MLEANEIKLPRKISIKTKIYRIRSQQIRESCINECLERRRAWDDHLTRIDAKKLVKFSWDNVTAGR